MAWGSSLYFAIAMANGGNIEMYDHEAARVDAEAQVLGNGLTAAVLKEHGGVPGAYQQVSR
jgi:uncharacterized protein (DUF2252 family)